MIRYAITNGSLAALQGGRPAARPETPGGRPHRADFALLARQAHTLAGTGVSFLLLRERALGAGELVHLAQTVVAATSDTALRVLVPGRTDVALAAGAAGVHLSASPGELRAPQVRRLMPSAFVSVSCHTLDEVRRAGEDGASAILFAPVFGKVIGGRAVTPGVGLEGLREACALAGAVPVLALGGVDASNAADCLAAGAAGVAGIRWFFPEGASVSETKPWQRSC